MTGGRTPIIRIETERVLLVPYFAPRRTPMPVPGAGIFDSPSVTVSLNVEWISHIIGILDVLDQPDAWEGDETAIFNARQEILKLQIALCDP